LQGRFAFFTLACMNIASSFAKKILQKPELAQLSFRVAVLDKYLEQSGTTVSRTDTVGRVKAATWSLDFGIAPGEERIHTSIALLGAKLPESERDHWLEHVVGDDFSANFLKMQSAHSCVDDGSYRAWGETAEEALF
jgi:hypothetical protein